MVYKCERNTNPLIVIEVNDKYCSDNWLFNIHSYHVTLILFSVLLMLGFVFAPGYEIGSCARRSIREFLWRRLLCGSLCAYVSTFLLLSVEDALLKMLQVCHWGFEQKPHVWWNLCIQGGPENARTMDIHYWIGNSSSQDEQGAAAVYVTQLDGCLGGSPVQYREVQGCESAKFKSYFKNGIMWVSRRWGSIM